MIEVQTEVVKFTRTGQLFVPGLTSSLVQPVKPIKIYQILTLDGSSIYKLVMNFEGLGGSGRTGHLTFSQPYLYSLKA